MIYALSISSLCMNSTELQKHLTQHINVNKMLVFNEIFGQ